MKKMTLEQKLSKLKKDVIALKPDARCVAVSTVIHNFDQTGKFTLYFEASMHHDSFTGGCIVTLQHKTPAQALKRLKDQLKELGV